MISWLITLAYKAAKINVRYSALLNALSAQNQTRKAKMQLIIPTSAAITIQQHEESFCTKSNHRIHLSSFGSSAVKCLGYAICLESLGSHRRGIGTSGAHYSLFRLTQELASEGTSPSLLNAGEAQVLTCQLAELSTHPKRQLPEVFWILVHSFKERTLGKITSNQKPSLNG